MLEGSAPWAGVLELPLLAVGPTQLKSPSREEEGTAAKEWKLETDPKRHKVGFGFQGWGEIWASLNADGKGHLYHKEPTKRKDFRISL